MSDRIVIHSYSRVFKPDRRIYRVDRWALPVPGGVPITGLAYFGVALFAVVILGVLPITGTLMDLLSPPLRYVLLPGAVAVAGTQANKDGRTALNFGVSWVTVRARRYRDRRSQRPVGWSARVPVTWDAEAPILRRCVVRGPAHVTFNTPVTFRNGRNRVIAVRNGATTGSVVVREHREVRVK